MTYRKRTIFFALAIALLVSMTAHARGERIEVHQTGVDVDLVPGADRGAVTYRLHRGTLAESGQEALFVITDASDQDFADRFGAIRADALEKAPDAALESAVFHDSGSGDGEWIFFNDPGKVARFGADGTVSPPMGNPNYSPLKKIRWRGRTVIVNAPFIKWGDAPGEQLLIDRGGCDPLIRSNPPSPFYLGGGPSNAHFSCENEKPLDRYSGGQVIDLDLSRMTVSMKLHQGTFRSDKVPYYTVFDASGVPPAGFMGVIHAPKMGNIGRYGENDAVGRIEQFANGVPLPSGGPDRFQPGIASYPGGRSKTYTPMWHITFLLWDCNGNGVFFRPDRNVGEGAVPVAGSGIAGFDPADPAIFDPFGMDDKGGICPDFASLMASRHTGASDGTVYYGDEEKLIEKGVLLRTEAPPGLRLDSRLLPPLIVNCPVPVTVRR